MINRETLDLGTYLGARQHVSCVGPGVSSDRLADQYVWLEAKEDGGRP